MAKNDTGIINGIVKKSSKSPKNVNIIPTEINIPITIKSQPNTYLN